MIEPIPCKKCGGEPEVYTTPNVHFKLPSGLPMPGIFSIRNGTMQTEHKAFLTAFAVWFVIWGLVFGLSAAECL
jgi:hypothetical protein